MTRGEVSSKKDLLLMSFVRCRRITQACEDAGVSTGFHYAAMRNDAAYRLAFADAQAEVAEELEIKAWEMATRGAEEVTVKSRFNPDSGEWEQTEKNVSLKRSERMLDMLLKAHNREKYGDKVKQELTGPNGAPLGGGPDLTKLSDDALSRIEQIIREEQGRVE